jgi:transcription elongation factor GreA
MDAAKHNLSLGEAATRFFTNLSSEEKGVSQHEVYKFVRWFGWERPLVELTPPEVANYAQRLSLSDTNYLTKLELIRAFLNYANRQGWSNRNLATHLKTKSGKTKSPVSAKGTLPGAVILTQEGYAKLEAELVSLKSKRTQVIDEISRAAADKDFRENAPLEAAREARGHLEGRIRKLEKTLGSATIIDEKQEVESRVVSIGDSVVLRDIASGEELHYIVVSPREVDPTKGKISSASPIGRAAVGQARGEVIEVAVPAGRVRYRIEQITH